MTNSIHILIGGRDAAPADAAQALSKRIRILRPADLESDADLASQVEIAFNVPARQVGQLTALKWLQTAGAGVNGLITPEMRDSDLVITNASGIHAEPITEQMFGMLLMVTRRLAEAWDQQKTRQWKGYPFDKQVTLLHGKTLGVLGVGAIGGHSARVGKAFGMRVIGLRRSGAPHPDVERMFTMEQRLEFFSECDVVMNSLPLTERTRGFMDDEAFQALKPGAIVINAGRGGTIDTLALVEALRGGNLGSALLDVTDPEPLPEEHPLWTMENVYITPHYSGSRPDYNQRAAAIFLENLRRYLAGEPLTNVVDKAEGY